MKGTLTADRLRNVLDYDKMSGSFSWITVSPKSRVVVGQKAGSLKNGYLYIKIDGIDYRAHRLAWIYMTGEWPDSPIDHINLNKADNSWSNLRKCSLSQNQANCRSRRTNRCGLKGVSWFSQRNKWRSQIFVRGKKICLGFFDNPEEAHAAYATASRKYFGEFGRAA